MDTASHTLGPILLSEQRLAAQQDKPAPRKQYNFINFIFMLQDIK